MGGGGAMTPDDFIASLNELSEDELIARQNELGLRRWSNYNDNRPRDGFSVSIRKYWDKVDDGWSYYWVQGGLGISLDAIHRHLNMAIENDQNNI